MKKTILLCSAALSLASSAMAFNTPDDYRQMLGYWPLMVANDSRFNQAGRFLQTYIFNFHDGGYSATGYIYGAGVNIFIEWDYDNNCYIIKEQNTSYPLWYVTIKDGYMCGFSAQNTIQRITADHHSLPFETDGGIPSGYNPVSFDTQTGVLHVHGIQIHADWYDADLTLSGGSQDMTFTLTNISQTN